MLKYNLETSTYEEYTVPEDWNVCMYSDDMNELINCANCGADITYGDGFTSRFIHNRTGFGYCVCEKCCELETNEELTFRKNKNK